MTIKKMQRHLAQMLAQAVEPSEAKAMADAIIEDIKSYKPIDLVLYGQRELLPDTVNWMESIAQKVIDGMPLQYAIGTAKFHGRDFKVDSSTLIPRPETSELVDLICKECSGRRDLDVLDIGTGTGCIAISLALDLRFSVVTAVDISADALKVASENSKALRAKVHFEREDIMNLPNDIEAFDIIVSNPPYVLESERKEMDSRVVNYEPSSALFVPDDDALRFYKPIAQYAKKALKPRGKLYFEINPLRAKQLKEMLLSMGFDAQILRDYKSAERFAMAWLS